MSDNLSFKMISLGCKNNFYESEMISKELCRKGYFLTKKEKADFYIINTCTVTNLASRKSRQIISSVNKKNNSSFIFAVGCYIENEPEILEKIPYLAMAIDNKNKINCADKIDKFLKDKLKISPYDGNTETDNKFYKNTNDSHILFERTRKYVKIQDGCNNFCSYCIIPYVRGTSKSRDFIDIENEILEFIKNGVKEIVLTGIHISSYGKDAIKTSNNFFLIDLLRKINEYEKIKRIRLSSLEPDLSEEFINTVSKLEKIAPHFHLSLQSGSNSVLSRMKRRYTVENFRSIVKLLRKKIKDVAITTDVIVGFPGESIEEFNDSFNFINEINFSKVHVFKFSKRDGTEAAKMPGHIDEKTKTERSRKIIDLSKTIRREFLNNYLSKIVSVLVEEKIENGLFRGFTGNYINVHVKILINNDYKVTDDILTKSLINEIIPVKITFCNNDFLIGEHIFT